MQFRVPESTLWLEPLRHERDQAIQPAEEGRVPPGGGLKLVPCWVAYVLAKIRFVDNTMSLDLRPADGAAPNLPTVCLTLKLSPNSVCGL